MLSFYLRRAVSALFLCSVIILISEKPVQAQWADNPADNLAIASMDGDLIQPKIALHPGGGAYISWMGNTGSGYDVFLQRVDADGNLLWESGGILVADRSFTSTEDYGLTVDSEGRAALAFRDDRFGQMRITAVIIDEDGTFVWGENGVDISGDAAFTASPRIAATSDGGFIAGFTGPGNAFVVKLNADGSIAWTREESASNNLALSDLAASDIDGETGSSVVLFRTFAPTAPGRLSAQKYNSEGDRIWGTDRIDVMTDGSLQFGNFPVAKSDGSGGMLVSWYQSQPSLQVYVQQIEADGEIRFQESGLPVSELASQLRTSASAAIDTDSGDVYVFWRETDSSQNLSGLYGQRITGGGVREWGDNALAVIPLGTQLGDINTFFFEGEPVVGYLTEESFGNRAAWASRLNSEGSFVWDDEHVVISEGGAGKSRLTAVNASDTEVFLAWEDDRDGSNDIFAQNLNGDGSLGPAEDDDPPPPQEAVTFQIDMSVQKQAGNFMPEAGDHIHLLGSFNDWSVSESSQMQEGENGEDAAIYTITKELEGEAGETYEYKYFIEAGDGRDLPNNGWEESVGPGENGNRVATLIGEDHTLEVVFFNNEDEFVSIGDTPERPVKLELMPNYPNPFNPSTVIRFALPEAGSVRLEVFNIQGQQVALLENGTRSAGMHQVVFDAGALASGVYISRLQWGNTVLTQKMMLVK